MAAQLSDDAHQHTTLPVRPEGLRKFKQSVENPKAPTEKLVALMSRRKDRTPKQK